MSDVELSIVILTWNTREMTAACLRSLLADESERAREIIVVDNASEDGTSDLIRNEFPTVRVIVNSENLLYAEGNNVGVRAASGEFVCILNSDTEVEPGALDGLVRYLEEDESCAIAGPRLIDDMGVQTSCGRQWDLIDALVYLTVLRRFPPGSIRFKNREFVPADDEPAAVDQVMGACWMMRRDEYLKYGGFSPELSLYFNDHDLCRRVRGEGRKVMYVPRYSIHHLRGQSTRLYLPSSHLFERNCLSYYRLAYGRSGFAFVYSLLLTKLAIRMLKSVFSLKTLARKREAFAQHRAYWAQVLSSRRSGA